eukprot:gnl/Chilomastix_caulleri/5278.p1 GENE.gnl/Chilomastix_caulleri/5278~~gnl/Chilomastix_caulleri/5278.p1  ORF type:complete len:65 (+),score=20.84 gnl/Chilomastix_caulleri/5278:33-227(+)
MPVLQSLLVFQPVKVHVKAGLTVNVTVPTYDKDSWKGYCPHNKQIYMGWETPAEHPAVKASVDA